MTESATASTSDRIVAAATVEFARYGIAGARVERIAKLAQTSKERVYAYFRSKDELYRFVAAQELAAMAAAVPLDPTDLPGYAGRVHDHVVAHPNRLRLMMWGQLELPPGDPEHDDPYRVALQAKVDQLRTAQRAGHIDSHWEPEDVLLFVSELATSWASQTDLRPDGADHVEFLAARRTAIVEAVQRLFPSTNTTTSHPPDGDRAGRTRSRRRSK